MHLNEITFLMVVSLLEFLQSAENSKYGFTDYTSQNYRRNENQNGRFILYRPIRNNYQYQKEQYYNRHQVNSGRIPYQSNREAHRFTPKNEYTRWNRIQTNDALNSYKKFDKRIGYAYTDNFNSPRKQKLQYDREESIADYVQRFNFQNNNPQTKFYNVPNDSTYNQPIEEEIFIEEANDNKHHAHNFQSSNNFPKGPLHQDLTIATFPINGPSSGISSFPNKHFATGPNPTHEEHTYFHYDQPDYELNDDNSDDKDIDPELIAIYKKVIEAYKKKQIQKKKQGNKNFYFGNQEKNNNKPLLFPQHNEPSELTNGKNHFLGTSNDRHLTNYPMPRQPNRNGFVFPGPVKLNNRHPNPQLSFQASPQFHKYSEPDPLYHPNGNPFEFHETSSPLPPQTQPPQVTTTSSTAQSNEISKLSTTEKNQDFPNSINAQLPPPEKDADTNIPYVAATALTPKTTLETSTTLATDSHTLQTYSVSASSTGESLISTLNSKNETSSLYNKLMITPIASNVASEIYAENYTVTPDFETVSTTVTVTEQPELFFLPTATEDIFGSSAKEMPIFEATVKTSEDPNKPTTYRRKFSPPVLGITNNEITTPAVAKQNETNISNYSLSLSYTAKYPHENENISTKKIKLDKKIISKKEDHILQDKYVDNNVKRHDDKHISSYASSTAMQEQITDVLPKVEATTVEYKNITAKNVVSNYTENVPSSNYLPNKNEESSEATFENYFEKSKESRPRKATEKEPLTTSVKGGDDNSFSTNTTDGETEYHLKPQKTYKQENNIHYIMSIINQARSHIILSQNDSQVKDV